jgi:hypothetical protein
LVHFSILTFLSSKIKYSYFAGFLNCSILRCIILHTVFQHCSILRCSILLAVFLNCSIPRCGIPVELFYIAGFPYCNIPHGKIPLLHYSTLQYSHLRYKVSTQLTFCPRPFLFSVSRYMYCVCTLICMYTGDAGEADDVRE